MTPILLICILSLFAYFAKGVTGAASAIVFNAGLLTALAFGLAGGLSLLDGLYWIALADFVSSALLAALLWRHIRFEKLTGLLLCGMLPVEVAFTLMLPHLDLRWLSLILALAVIACGLYLAFRPTGKPASERAMTIAAMPMGALAGTLGGLFGMGGPVVFVLLSRASDDPGRFRSRTLVITVATGLTRFVTLTAMGVLTQVHFTWLAYASPVIVVALLAGIWAHRRIKPRPFRIALGLTVTLAGIGGLLRFALL
jgi:uncharacterized protein